MARLSGGHAGQSLQGLLHVGLTVLAHHPLDDQRLPRSLDPRGEILRERGFFPDAAVPGGVMDPAEILPQGVGDDAEAGQTHGQRAEHGAERPPEDGDPDPGSQGDAEHIVNKRPEQVFLDIPKGGPAQTDGGGHVGEAAVHQNDAGCLDGDIRSRADGDSGVGQGEGGGVVDPVADHGHLSDRFQLPDHVGLSVGEDAGHDLIHAGLPSDGPGGALVVSG